MPDDSLHELEEGDPAGVTIAPPPLGLNVSLEYPPQRGSQIRLDKYDQASLLPDFLSEADEIPFRYPFWFTRYFDHRTESDFGCF